MTTTTSSLPAALEYAERGWRVIPIPPGIKHPAIEAWQDAATTDLDLVRQWWKRWPHHGVGIVTGRASGIFVLDVDVSNGKHGDETLADLEATYGPLPATTEVITGTGGRHLYFAMPEGVTITNDQAGRLGPHLDIRGEGGQVLAPPTVHPNGTPYEWELSSPHTPVLPPDWLVALLTTPSANEEPRRDRKPYDGPERPGDRFAAAVSWPDLLEPDGATFIERRTRRQDGTVYELWARPGLHGKDVHTSATLYYGGSDLLKVFSSDWPGLEQDKTYTRFGYFAATRFAGDHSEASRQLRRAQDDADVLAYVRSAPMQPAVVAPPAVAVDGDLTPAPQGEPTTWEELDLAPFMADDYEPLVPDLVDRQGGGHLFYARRTNVLMGESGSGKSWVALLACAVAIAAGRHAVYVDLEDHPRSIVERLRALGVPMRSILERFHYLRPELAASTEALEVVDAIIETHDAAVVVIDSVGEAMALQGLKQNDDDEVARWYRRLPKRWAALGPAAIAVDHIPKDPDGPRLYAIGSQRKRAAVDGVQYRVDQVKPFSREHAGMLNLTCAKDRNGAWPTSRLIAEVVVEPADFGKIVTLSVRAPEGRDEATGKVTRPTMYMERISDYLGEVGEQTARKITAGVKGNDTAKRQALRVLEEEGFVETVERTIAGQLVAAYRLLKPFKITDDDVEKYVNEEGAARRGQGAAKGAASRAVPVDKEGAASAATATYEVAVAGRALPQEPRQGAANDEGETDDPGPSFEETF